LAYDPIWLKWNESFTVASEFPWNAFLLLVPLDSPEVSDHTAVAAPFSGRHCSAGSHSQTKNIPE
jgi:hypothetical protein